MAPFGCSMETIFYWSKQSCILKENLKSCKLNRKFGDKLKWRFYLVWNVHRPRVIFKSLGNIQWFNKLWNISLLPLSPHPYSLFTWSSCHFTGKHRELKGAKTCPKRSIYFCLKRGPDNIAKQPKKPECSGCKISCSIRGSSPEIIKGILWDGV